MHRARNAVEAAGQKWKELTETELEGEGTVMVGTMHLAKGLEFKAVAVIACDEDVLPLQSRMEAVADETELDEVYETERHLLYVASTRARDLLLVTAVRPGSEYLKDLA
jgi:superfamily I DNA/RNA helicase